MFSEILPYRVQILGVFQGKQVPGGLLSAKGVLLFLHNNYQNVDLNKTKVNHYYGIPRSEESLLAAPFVIASAKPVPVSSSHPHTFPTIARASRQIL